MARVDTSFYPGAPRGGIGGGNAQGGLQTALQNYRLGKAIKKEYKDWKAENDPVFVGAMKKVEEGGQLSYQEKIALAKTNPEMLNMSEQIRQQEAAMKAAKVKAEDNARTMAAISVAGNHGYDMDALQKSEPEAYQHLISSDNPQAKNVMSVVENNTKRGHELVKQANKFAHEQRFDGEKREEMNLSNQEKKMRNDIVALSVFEKQLGVDQKVQEMLGKTLLRIEKMANSQHVPPEMRPKFRQAELEKMFRENPEAAEGFTDKFGYFFLGGDGKPKYDDDTFSAMAQQVDIDDKQLAYYRDPTHAIQLMSAEESLRKRSLAKYLSENGAPATAILAEKDGQIPTYESQGKELPEGLEGNPGDYYEIGGKAVSVADFNQKMSEGKPLFGGSEEGDTPTNQATMNLIGQYNAMGGAGSGAEAQAKPAVVGRELDGIVSMMVKDGRLTEEQAEKVRTGSLELEKDDKGNYRIAGQ